MLDSEHAITGSAAGSSQSSNRVFETAGAFGVVRNEREIMGKRVLFICAGFLLLGCEQEGQQQPPPMDAPGQLGARSGLQASDVVDAKSDTFELQGGAVTVSPKTTSMSPSFKLVSSVKAEVQR